MSPWPCPVPAVGRRLSSDRNHSSADRVEDPNGSASDLISIHWSEGHCSNAALASWTAASKRVWVASKGISMLADASKYHTQGADGSGSPVLTCAKRATPIRMDRSRIRSKSRWLGWDFRDWDSQTWRKSRRSAKTVFWGRMSLLKWAYKGNANKSRPHNAHGLPKVIPSIPWHF